MLQMKLQNSRLANLQSDLEEIRSLIKSGNIHLGISSYVKQDNTLLSVTTEITATEVDVFINYLFDKLSTDKCNIIVTFNDLNSFTDIALRICNRISTTTYSISVDICKQKFTLIPFKMVDHIRPTLLDQYINQLNQLKENTK